MKFHFLKEFKEFINRGNVVDMAVGIIIGASFNKIINILVSHVLMPPIGFLLGGVDFSDLRITLKKAEGSQEAVTIDYGLFINTLIDFLIIAFTIFFLLKILHSVKNPFASEQAASEQKKTEKECPYCIKKIPAEAQKCPYCTSVLERSN